MVSSSYQMKQVLSFCYMGEGFTSFSINNRTNFFGEKKVKWSVPERQLLFENTRKNLILILVSSSNLSKALYYSQTEAHWFFDPQKTYENPRPISTSMKIIDYVVFFTSVFVFSNLGTEQQQSYSAI